MNGGWAPFDPKIERIVELEAEHDATKAELVELRATIDRLTAGLRDAIECVESWAAYADDYFATKHDLAGDLARLRAALKGTS